MKLFGIYRGYIEYINDPEQRGRVRVRIPNLTGYPSDVDTTGLPWAETANMFGGGHDYGSKVIPPVGSTCFVMFEGGNPEKPVVVGTWDGNPNKTTHMLRDVTGKYPGGEVSMSPSPTQPWEAVEGPDAPKEYLQQVDNRPERYVPFKSVKGAIFDIEDRDEVEHTRVLDRIGQGLFISGAVKAVKEGSEVANLNNEAQRGLKNSLDGTALPLESTMTNEGTVSLIDIGSQSLSLISKKDANKIQLISKQGILKDSLTESGNKETFGKSNVNMELNSGNKSFTLDIQDNGMSIAKLTINGDTGIIEIESPSLVRIKSDRIVLDGDTNISGNLTVNKTITCNEDGLFAGIILSN